MRLLLASPHRYSPQQLGQLEALGYEVILFPDESKELPVDPATVDAVVCMLLFQYHDLALFTRLKLIRLTTAGMDLVPVASIRERGIALYNASDVYSIPIAEWVVLKILEIYKRSRVFERLQAEHVWKQQRGLLELAGKTACIVGYGSIGREVAKRLKAFDVCVIGVHHRPVEAGGLDELVMIGDLDRALAVSDIVVSTLPLTSETRHLFDGERIARIKCGAVLVNVSRGAVIDEAALIEAIRGDRFSGVALDVFEDEPLSPDSPLWDLEKVIVTPHNSFASDGVNRRLFGVIAKNLAAMAGNGK